MVNAFDAIKTEFLRDHPCVTDLIVSYGSSATLATQIVSGSPADVFVAASQSAMDTVTKAGLAVGQAVVFARNKAEIMVAPNSSLSTRVSTVADLARKDIKVGLCVATAPCGSMADAVLEKSRTYFGNAQLVRTKVAASETSSVEDLVTKVELGEFDAGIVYHSDCRHAAQQGSATCVAIPDNINSTNAYLVAVVSSRSVAREFADYVASDAFTSMLRSVYGFLAP